MPRGPSVVPVFGRWAWSSGILLVVVIGLAIVLAWHLGTGLAAVAAAAGASSTTDSVRR